MSSFREPNVAIEAIKGQQTLAELSTKFELTQQQISTWKREFLSKAAIVFTQEVPEKARDKELQSLYAKIKFPYLLRGLEIDHCNQVWEMDITYIPMKKGVHVPCRHHRRVQPVYRRMGHQQHDGLNMN